jgi:signal transduction histidine kinase
MRPRTLRARFILIVVLGAVLPLALVGVWMSRSTERAGRALLQSQLESAAGAIVARADRQWNLRAGEIQLLANNTVAQRLLGGAALARDDSAYLQELAQAGGSGIVSFSYVTGAGTAAWSSPAVARAHTLRVEAPVQKDGRAVGTLVAHVRLGSVVSIDSGQTLAPGVTLSIDDAQGVLWSSSQELVDSSSSDWAVVRAAPRAAPLRLTLAAPVAPFVKPFERAAGAGLLMLMAVALVALVLSAVLATRVTRSLGRLSDAAGAVAAGDLERSVSATGDDEVARLAGSFNVMTESLRSTVAELSRQRAMAAVGEFAASMAHDVRNSLTAIRVDLQHALRHLPKEDPGAKLGARALDSVRRLDATVTAALGVARGGRNGKRTVQLGDVLERAVAAAEPSFIERGALLEPIAPHAPVPIAGDAAALEQLFLNLLLNAAQALEPGGRARVEMETAAGSVTVRVVDTGHGIPAEELSTSGRLPSSTKPGGTGLGLPIARRIAVAHGGDLEILSRYEVGTTVVVKLPYSV